MLLEEVFRAELAAAGGDVATAGLGEDELAALLSRARAAHPDLAVADEAFVAALARSAARAHEAGVRAGALAVEDLYLAAACAVGVAGAAAAFEARCGQRLRATLGAVTQSEDERREGEQRVRDLLIVGGPDAPPKITTYGGQGPLDRWVAVVAQRMVVTVIRAEQAERRARENAAVEAAVDALAISDPEVALLKEKYRADFEQAMAEALASVGERERLILRLHLCGRVTVEGIGKMYGVSQSTASRWLAEARGSISDQVTRTLRERLGLGASELRSLAGLVASQLDLSLSRLLGVAREVGEVGGQGVKAPT